MTMEHITVFKNEAVEQLAVRPDGVYVDCTVGLAGHSELIAESLGRRGRLLAFDRDATSLHFARQKLSRFKNVEFFHENFKNLPLILRNLQIPEIDGCLIDLGVSRYQLTAPDRGFTFQEDGPLDMRMDRDQQLTAEKLVNQLPERDLVEIFRSFGEEPQAKRIARSIAEERQKNRIRTTSQLADLIVKVKGRNFRTKIHPATQVFQALRIEVNQELQALDQFLARTIALLRSGGRLAVITFHSLEDRIVKQQFRLEAGKCICFRPGDLCSCPRIERISILTRKPIKPSEAELAENPSSRSAKLRVIEKLPGTTKNGESL